MYETHYVWYLNGTLPVPLVRILSELQSSHYVMDDVLMNKERERNVLCSVLCSSLTVGRYILTAGNWSYNK